MTIEIEYQLTPQHEVRVHHETFYSERSADSFIKKVKADIYDVVSHVLRKKCAIVTGKPLPEYPLTHVV